jgi:hypothetical protein
MEAQIDSSPSDKSSDDIKNNSISRKPVSQESRHHEGISSMTAGKTGVKDLSRASGEF